MKKYTKKQIIYLTITIICLVLATLTVFSVPILMIFLTPKQIFELRGLIMFVAIPLVPLWFVIGGIFAHAYDKETKKK